MKSAMTVLGPVPGDELGTTLMHEHLVIDFRCRYAGSPETDSIGPELDPRDRWRLVNDPAGFEANLVRTDVAAAAEEVAAFSRVGGKTIVDATTEGLGPDAAALRQVAQVTGAHIIAGTGMYVHRSHAPSVCDASVSNLADRMIRSISEPDTAGIRRGFIGEIGVDGPTDCELNVVRAAAVAQRETHAPVSIHLLHGAIADTRADALLVVDEFVAAGGDPHRLIACHSDGTGSDRQYQNRLLERGVVLEYDTFGFESVFGYQGGFVQLPTDTRRIEEVADLWDRGWGDQIVLSQDVCYRMMTREWGGWGIAHILEALPHRFSAAGLGPRELDTMMIATPRRLLAFM